MPSVRNLDLRTRRHHIQRATELEVEGERGMSGAILHASMARIDFAAGPDAM